MITDNGTPILGKNPAVTAVSNSEIQCMKDCKRKWWLAYYRGLRPRKAKLTGPLILGTRIHNALEAYYSSDIDIVEEYKQLLEIDRALILETNQDMDRFDSDGELGRIMVEGYDQWLEETGADADLEVVGAEQVVSAPLMNGAVELRGKLDLRVLRRADNVRLAIDHKSCATFDSVTRTAHIAEQPLMYQLLEMLTTKDGEQRCDGLIYNMLRKVKRTGTAKPPFYERLEVHFNRRTMESFWYRIHGTLTDMLRLRRELDAGVDHRQVAYPTPSQDCAWKCEFFAACPLFDDGSAVEEMIDMYYESGSPYERYGDAAQESLS